MAFDPISAGFSLVDTLVGAVSKYFDNQSKAELAKIDIQRIVAEHLREVDKGQIEINKAEAASTSIWVAGWRPFIGWSCALGVMYAWMFRPLTTDVLIILGFGDVMLPDLQVEGLITMLCGLLGLAGMRTAEKIKGV